MNKGYPHIYTGNGKGKTTAAFGLHPIMFAGTGSDVGKSLLAAAFCRILRQDGYDPAPFKAQNMALNSFVTADGGEMGRAQVVQAEAAGVECHTDMNPLLLKPNTDKVCQVILNGRVVGNSSAAEFFRAGPQREALRREVCAAYDRLAARHNPVVLEGAGSISELNLRNTDLVNMPMAAHAGADVFLVADIDRGGVFASVYGTMQLLEEWERRLVKGIFINKFRGDLSLFDEGRRMLEKLCGIPVLGVIPYLRDVHIEAEDSVALDRRHRRAEPGKVNIAVVLLRHLSNFTDFDTLERRPGVCLYYTDSPEALDDADIIFLPGSKSVMPDLAELRRKGLADKIVRLAEEGRTVAGICGGYQMMGHTIRDPHRIESDTETMPGLGLLPVGTVLTGEKVTRQVRFTLPGDDRTGSAYEIHMGRTAPLPGHPAEPLTRLADGTGDGCVAGNCLGTYLHGLADNSPFIDRLLRPFADRLPRTEAVDARTCKEQQYDLLADHVRRSTDMEQFYRIVSV